MKKKREMEMKKQFLKSAAILSLAVTAVSTSQSVGAIVREFDKTSLPISNEKRFEGLSYESQFFAYTRLVKHIDYIKDLLNLIEYQEQEYKIPRKKLLNELVKYENILISYKEKSTSKPENQDAIKADNNLRKQGKMPIYKYLYIGVEDLTPSQVNYIVERLNIATEEFKKEASKIQHSKTDLKPLFNHQKGFNDLREIAYSKIEEINLLVEAYSVHTNEDFRYYATLLDETCNTILRIDVNDKNTYEWWNQILNERTGKDLIDNLDYSINEFFDNINMKRPTKLYAYNSEDTPYERRHKVRENIKKITQGELRDKSLTKINNHRESENLELNLSTELQYKDNRSEYLKNISKHIDEKLKNSVITEGERLIKQFKSIEAFIDETVKKRAFEISKYINLLKLRTTFTDEISDKIFRLRELNNEFDEILKLYTNPKSVNQGSHHQRPKMMVPENRLKQQISRIAPQKETVKEKAEQKVSGKTQDVEKKSETVATPQQSSTAQTSVQQPAPVQPVVQESKASQEEINAAHDAISAYKSTVNIANTAGVTTAEMTTLINTQTSNLSDVEKALGNNKVNNGAVNVLREDTAHLENMIWNRAYQAIEEFNVARNTYNNQIKTETVPVDNDIEAILAGSQAKISHLDNRIGARHMDQAFVASLLEVTEMSKSISSRIKE